MSAILKNVSVSHLEKIVEVEKIYVRKDAARTHLVDAISEEVNTIGVKHLTMMLKKTQLSEICASLGIEAESKPVLQKRLYEAIVKQGASDFFGALDKKSLQVIMAAMGEDTAVDAKKSAKRLADLIEILGSEVFFARFEVPFLKELMRDMELETNSVASKNSLVRAIIDQTDAEKATRPNTEIKFSKSKKEIAKGITYQDIFQWYKVEEVRDWCRDNELKVSGTKPELINRVLAFLDGDKENTMSSQPKKSEETEKPAKKEVAKPAKETEVKKGKLATKEVEETSKAKTGKPAKSKK
eukprot:TRINITY_DN1780_c0_g2_i1.p2 TRINITY_DN1780_c0_g2~~TRINITY_DN1780_c0_g2_i1.p2  ORF type:complete len:298 (+),score=96.84 TRINITY_DN1780_c0_g2_i1:1710-2603(+)